MNSFVNIQDMALAAGGKLRLGEMPPLGGAWEPVGKIVSSPGDVAPGDVYLALPEAAGANPYGHEEAFHRGALGVISASRVEPWAGRFSLQVADTRWSLWQLARTARQRFGGQVVAVAGDVGKTICGAMIDAVLSGSLRGAWQESRRGREHLALQLANLADDGAYFIGELHADAKGDLDALAHLCCPHVSVFTAFAGRESLTAQLAAELLATLPDDGCTVQDEAAAMRLGTVPPGVSRVVCGRGGQANIVATHVLCEGGRLSFAVDGQLARVHAWGRHFLPAALAAWGVGRRMGLADGAIAQRLEAFTPPPHRCAVACAGGATIVDDTLGRARESYRAAFGVLQTIGGSGQRIVGLGSHWASPAVEGGRRWSDDDVAEVGREAVTLGGADLLAAAGPRAEPLLEAARRAGMPSRCCLACASDDDLAEKILRKISAGDVLLWKGVDTSSVHRVFNALAERTLSRAA